MFDLLVRQRRFIYLAVALASAAGIGCAFLLPSAIYPELLFPRIAVVAQGSSLGARQVVFSITRPIEEAVSVVPGVRRVHSRSIRGASEISIWFSPNTDMINALDLVRARVNQITPDLPPALDVQVERMTPSLFPVLSYNLEGGDPATLYDIARYEIMPVLSRMPGVGRVQVQGTDVREIEVVADPTRLATLGLTYDALAGDIRQAITPEAVGRMAKDYKQYLIVTDQDAHTPEDVGNVVIGNGLRVKDVATVNLGTEDHVRIISGDGKSVAAIFVTRQIGGNTLELADSVAKTVAALAPTLPPGVHFVPVYDQASLVRDAVRAVRDAMLIGAVLAVVILLAFLRRGRITAISASSIPLTMVITIFVMYLAGQTFNLMTLGAMALAIGLVIDDAVVITENIARHLLLVPDRHVAVREAVQELIWPVATSTITTVVVFLPLGLLQGVAGQFFAALGLTLTIAVLISLILAFTIIPLLSDQYLREADIEIEAGSGSRRRGGLAAVFDLVGHALNGLGDAYARALASVLHHRRRVFVGALVLIVGGVVVQRFLGSGFLPDMDEGAFVLDYWTPGGTALAETDREMRIVERILAEEPEVSATSRRTGAELGLFATLQNTGDVVVRLKPRSQRKRTIFQVMDDVRDKVNAAIPTLHVEFIQILSDVINDLSGAGAKPIEIKLFGSQLDQLEAYARRLSPALTKVEGLEDLYDGVSLPAAEMLLKVDQAEASRIGMTPTQVGAGVSGALLGVDAGQVRTEDRAINVRVRAPDSVRFDPIKLGSLPISAGVRGQVAPLAALGTIRAVDSRAELNRENQQQMIAMTADVSGRSLGQVIGDVKRVLAANPPPGGIRTEFGGQYASQQDAFRALLMVLLLAAVSVIAVMVLQFESFVEPLSIALAAPVSFIGAIGMLLVTGTPLNVSSFMGLILLVGLIVKNGIILLDFTRRRGLYDGMPLEQAIIDAGRVRLRPILMTTLCTLFGLFPLALGIGAGSEMQQPLAL
ncbi:MAG TPA: efflux RND transporter permease subunit, partial [Gemmatimonadales bacterium]|nr:efflux RND transporter permease subunit [Gemmatimonadales bacterium]